MGVALRQLERELHARALGCRANGDAAELEASAAELDAALRLQFDRLIGAREDDDGLPPHMLALRARERELRRHGRRRGRRVWLWLGRRRHRRRRRLVLV